MVLRPSPFALLTLTYHPFWRTKTGLRDEGISFEIEISSGHNYDKSAWQIDRPKSIGNTNIDQTQVIRFNPQFKYINPCIHITDTHITQQEYYRQKEYLRRCCVECILNLENTPFVYFVLQCLAFFVWKLAIVIVCSEPIRYFYTFPCNNILVLSSEH